MTRQVTPIDVDRELVRRGGLHAFIRKGWSHVEPGQFKDNWHIGAMSEHLEACHTGEINRLIINVPPGSMKSLSTAVFFPVWSWISKPTNRFHFLSYDDKLSKRDAIRSRDLIKSEWFQDRWGGVNGVQISRKTNNAGFYYNTKNGFRLTVTLQGGSTGHHAHGQVVDDPIKPKDTQGGADQTRTILKKVEDIWSGTLATRIAEPDYFFRIIVMQRLHDADLCGSELTAGGYVHLMLPMHYEPARKCISVFGSKTFEDPRTEEGELLWPNRYDEAAVKQVEKDLGPFAEAQLQQNPVPTQGGVFKRDWIKYWSYNGEIEGTVPLPTQLTRLQSWDMRFIESEERGDYVVGQEWGRGYFANMIAFFLLDQVRGRWSFSDTCDQARAFAAAHPTTIQKLVEDKANGPAVVNTLKKEIAGFEEVTPEGGKEARAWSTSPLWKGLCVFLPHPSIPGFEWVKDFVTELIRFPKAPNDDQVDAMTQALVQLYLKTPGLLEALAKMNAEKKMAEEKAKQEAQARELAFKQPEGPPGKSFAELMAKVDKTAA